MKANSVATASSEIPFVVLGACSRDRVGTGFRGTPVTGERLASDAHRITALSELSEVSVVSGHCGRFGHVGHQRQRRQETAQFLLWDNLKIVRPCQAHK